MDAANLLKPMLARGELRCIGATTLNEYRKHMEKDAAFERRFQQVHPKPSRPQLHPVCPPAPNPGSTEARAQPSSICFRACPGPCTLISASEP